MVVLVLPPVSGFPVASPCLWGKLQNLSFCHVANCENWRKSRTKCGWFTSTCLVSSRWFSCGFAVSMGEAAKPPFRMCPSRLSCRFAWQAWHFLTFQPVWWCFENVKIGGSLVRNAGFSTSTCLVSSRWFSCGVAVSIVEAGKHLLFECVQAGCHVVLRGRRGTLWHSNLFDNVLKMSKLEEVSYEMLVFLYHATRLESLVFLWRRRVYGEAGKPVLFECVQAGCHAVLRGRRGTLWHSNLFDNVSQMSKLEEVSYEMLVFLHPRVLSRVAGFPAASPCL